MPVVYFVELSPQDLAALGWAAGNAAGSGNEELGRSLGNILQRIQIMDVDESMLQDSEEEEPEELAEIIELDRTVDPQFAPPIPSPPTSNQGDYGAGPPPSG